MCWRGRDKEHGLVVGRECNQASQYLGLHHEGDPTALSAEHEERTGQDVFVTVDRINVCKRSLGP